MDPTEETIYRCLEGEQRVAEMRERADWLRRIAGRLSRR